jgi:hypothetical protein
MYFIELEVKGHQYRRLEKITLHPQRDPLATAEQTCALKMAL